MEEVLFSFTAGAIITLAIVMIILRINPFDSIVTFFKREKTIMLKKESLKNYQYKFDASVPIHPKEIYGTLPKHTKKKFSVMYEHTYEGFENIFIFKSFNEKWGALKFENGQYHIISENIYDSTGFYAQYGLIEAVIYHDNTYSGKKSHLLFNTEGRLVKRMENFDYIRFDFYGNIITSKKGLYGFLDINLEEKSPCKYNGLRGIGKNIFVATENNNSRHLIINEKEEIIFECKFPISIYDEVYNNKIIIEENDKYYSLDLLSKEKMILPYDRIYKIRGYEINSRIAPRYITIKDYIDNEEKYEYYLLHSNAFVMIEGKYGVITGDGEVCIPNIYDKIDFLSEKYFKVALGKFSFEINEETDDILASGGKWGIADIENNIIVPVQYTDIVYAHHENRYFAYENGIMEGRNDDHNGEYMWSVKDGKRIELTNL